MGRKHPTNAPLPWQSNKKWLENHLPRANLPQLGSQVLLNLATYQESRFSHGPINGEPKDISMIFYECSIIITPNYTEPV